MATRINVIKPNPNLLQNPPANQQPVRQRYSLVFWGIAAIILTLLLWAYWKHFDNPFEFDDEHTIVHNSALDTMNLREFMTNPATFSSLPANQAWRPGVTIMNSWDTLRSENHVPDPFQFHLNIFISYIILGVLLFFMFLWFFRKIFPELSWNNLTALLCTGFFLLHTANAETINYIISRSDTQSTVFIVLAVVMFQYSEISRKYFLFLIPMVIGFMFKEVALMIAPLLLVFCWLFTVNFSKNIAGIIAAFIAAAGLFLLSKHMTLPTWTSGGGNAFLYLCTQAFVIVHYCFTFILPTELSADTDWTYVTSPYDTRVLIGVVFIAFLFYLAFRWSKKEQTKIASFGIFWFFIALAPTSSVFPFSEVMNDHRVFFPFIGLILVVANWTVIALKKLEAKKNDAVKIIVYIALGFTLVGHAYGTRVRCEVWGSGESLWKDVTIKSPKNGRGLMNYALAVMPRNLDSAITMFEQVREMMPYYSYAYINLGVAYDRKGNLVEAENNYKAALNLDAQNPEAYYYYGEWLIRQQRVNEAMTILESGHALSPGHTGINSLLDTWRGRQYQTPLEYALQTADQNPTAENLLALSLEWYNAGEYLQCALTAEKAAGLKPDYNLAWNNICAGYNKIGEWDKAIAAGQQAAKLDPTDERSKNNLAFAVSEKARFDSLIATAKSKPTADNWVIVSLNWYNAANYKKCIEAAQEAIKINPNDATAWNNICAAANRTGEFDLAIEAGEKALKLDPDMEIAKNNLAEAKRLKGVK